MASRIILATCSMAERWLKSLDPDNGHYPLGIAYLHAALEKAGHEVRMQFLNHVPHEECLATIMDQIATFEPHILGLSIISDSRVSSFRTIEAVHARHPDIQIVLGGVHVTTMKRQIAQRFPYCTLCLGESETTVCELTEVFETGGDRAKVNGLAYFDDGELRITPERELIADLDELPFARHEKLKLPSAKMGASALTHAAYKNWVTCLPKDCVGIATVFAMGRRG